MSTKTLAFALAADRRPKAPATSQSTISHSDALLVVARACATGQDIAARTAIQAVNAISAVEPVGPFATAQAVVACAARQQVVLHGTGDPVVQSVAAARHRAIARFGCG